jgi:hypothetical protein
MNIQHREGCEVASLRQAKQPALVLFKLDAFVQLVVHGGIVKST